MATPRATSRQKLEHENRTYRATGGVSANNRCLGFRPAFRDGETGTIYPSLNARGQPCPFHCLEGLPPELVTERSRSGGVVCVKASLEAGFELDGRFYSRAEAAEMVVENSF